MCLYQFIPLHSWIVNRGAQLRCMFRWGIPCRTRRICVLEFFRLGNRLNGLIISNLKTWNLECSWLFQTRADQLLPHCAYFIICWWTHGDFHIWLLWIALLWWHHVQVFVWTPVLNSLGLSIKDSICWVIWYFCVELNEAQLELTNYRNRSISVIAQVWGKLRTLKGDNQRVWDFLL